MKKYIKIIKPLIALSLTLMMFSPVCAPAAASYESYEYSDYDWDRFRGKNMSVNVYNWGEYISVDDGEEDAFDTNKAFTELTGIRVNYSNFASNEEMYAKLKSGGSSYDIIIPSDYMIARMANENMLEKINFSNVPNFSYIAENFRNNAFDVTNEYSVPYMWGIMGIIYNKTLFDESDNPATWDILWNEKYAKDILMFSNSRDSFAISLFRLGYSVNTTDENELREAAAELSKQKLLIQAYVMDEIFDKMGGGEAALAPYYAGDAITMMEDNPDLEFVVPEEGTNVFIDAMCIPKGAKNKEAAEMYINFLCETRVALKNCEYIGYSTPHIAVYELLDDETKESISYPSEEALSKAQEYITLPSDTTRLLDSLWTELMSQTGKNPWLSPVLIVVSVTLIIFINVRRYRKKKTREL
ncbi:MAG: ABC transporter substrate-binding protein [Eubacteriales bacterium]|nr:ABC transporter substrate-binding protein [Eubacteriales bacterium]